MRRLDHIPLWHHPRFWDAAIAVFAATGVLGILCGVWFIRSTDADAAGWILGGASLAGLLLLLYGSFIEPKRISLNTISVHIAGVPSMRIAIVGDMHVGPFKNEAFLQRVVRRLNSLRPDLTVLTGDFVYDHMSGTAPLNPLQDLKARLGVFGVLGNHDAGGHLLHGERVITKDRSDEVERVLRALGIPLLRNTHVRLELGGQAFVLAGIDDLWMESSSMEKAFDDVSDDMSVILLSHNPDVILDPASRRAALILSGHTHGGQVRVPGIGPVYPLPTRLGRGYDHGIFRLEQGTVLAITHGLGETMARSRLFCPPEILVLEVNKE